MNPPPRSRERRALILQRATESGPTSVDDLARSFGVTASTIRRDLAELSASGRLARTYGGAIATPLGVESSVQQRDTQAHEAKLSIARWAASQIPGRSSVLLDAGSTVALLARQLPTGADLTVTTASVPVIGHTQAREDVTLQCLGGRLRALSDAFVGALTEAALERLTFDIAFLGADGVTSAGELCEAEPDQTRLKELMARRAGRVFVLVHAAKLNHRPFHYWARLEGSCTVVTDADADPAVVAEFTAAGQPIVVVDPT